MNATIIARTPTSFTLQVEILYSDSMLDFEETLQERLNDAGVVATVEGLKQFDTDGLPITVGPVKFTTKGQVEKDYQTPFGVAPVAIKALSNETFSPLSSVTTCRAASRCAARRPVRSSICFSAPRVQVIAKPRGIR